MTIIFTYEGNPNGPMKYEGTEEEYDFLCMLSSEDMLDERVSFWDLDGLDEIRKDRRLRPE